MTIREQMLPIGTRVRHLKGFPGDDQRTYPAGIEGLIVSHGSLGYHGISFVFEDIEATFLFLADEVEVLPVISAEETLRAELEATRKTLTEVEGRARRYAEERDAAQSALTVRYAMRREIEAKLGMVSGEANDESLRRGLEAIRALELRAEKAERERDEARAQLLREAATTTRLTAYRILAQIAVDADDTDEAAADDLRSLLDVLWRQLTDADRAAFRDEAEKPR